MDYFIWLVVIIFSLSTIMNGHATLVDEKPKFLSRNKRGAKTLIALGLAIWGIILILNK